MKNTAAQKKSKTTDNKEDTALKSSKSTKPEFNSATGHRNSDELPQVENLNQDIGEFNEKNAAKAGKNQGSLPQNDNSLYGKKTKTDLGNGKPSSDEKEKEKIIRT